MVNHVFTAAALVVACLACAGRSFGQESDGQALGQAANDPTAALASVQVQDIFVSDFHNLDDESGNTLLLRAALPYSWGDTNHIARVSLPMVTDSPSGESGLGDMTLFDLTTFDQSWGRWGVGPVMLVPTATDEALGQEKWAIGPAVGFVASQGDRLVGLFNQNLLSFAGEDDRDDIALSIIQPIFNQSLGNGWSVGLSDMSITYNWETSEWISLPLGMNVNKLGSFAGRPIQAQLSYEYNFADDVVVGKHTLNFTLKMLFPL